MPLLTDAPDLRLVARGRKRNKLTPYVMNTNLHLPLPFTWLCQESHDLPLPAYATEMAAGMDICAALSEALTLAPGDIVLIPCGFSLAIPPGYEIQIRPRSGLAVKHGVTVINAPGTIDADYRGEIKVGLINLGKQAYTIHRGDRIAQMVLAPVLRAVPHIVLELDQTKRGEGGFGHTGL